MARLVKYKLTKTQRADGKQQISIWLKIDAKLQPQLKTNIWINAKNFEAESEHAGAKVGFIKIPKSTKLADAKDVNEAKQAQSELLNITNKLLKCLDLMPASELNKESIKNLADAIVSEKNITLEAITKDKVKALTAKKSDADLTLLMLQFINIKPKCEKDIKTLFRALLRWCAYKHTEIDINSLTTDNLCDFRDFLKHQSELMQGVKVVYPDALALKQERPWRNVGTNSMHSYFAMLKTFWHFLMNKGITTNNPFAKFDNEPMKYGTPIYLTEAERNALYQADLGGFPMLSRVRDMFVFQCLVGCRYSDLMLLSEKNITNNFLEYIPKKTAHNTQVKARVPLLGVAREIIEKRKTKQGKLFPSMSIGDYNEHLKELFAKIGITRNVSILSPSGEIEQKPLNEIVSSHMARRTFIGITYSKVQDPNIIGKMSGHTEGSKAFARYRNIDDDLLLSVIEKIDL